VYSNGSVEIDMASNGGRELQREVGDLRKYDESVKLSGLQSRSQL